MTLEKIADELSETIHQVGELGNNALYKDTDVSNYKEQANKQYKVITTLEKTNKKKYKALAKIIRSTYNTKITPNLSSQGAQEELATQINNYLCQENSDEQKLKKSLLDVKENNPYLYINLANGFEKEIRLYIPRINKNYGLLETNQ